MCDGTQRLWRAGVARRLRQLVGDRLSVAIQDISLAFDSWLVVNCVAYSVIQEVTANLREQWACGECPA